MPLPPTPWLNPPDYTGAYLRGAQIGASAQESRNRMAVAAMEAASRTQIAAQQHAAQLEQQAQLQHQRLEASRLEAQMRAQTQIQIANQRSEEQKQRIAIDAAYKDTMAGLNHQKVEIAKQKQQFDTERAARQAAAMMEWQQSYKPGDEQGNRELLMRLAPEMGATGTSIVNALGRGGYGMPESVAGVPVTVEGRKVEGMAAFPGPSGPVVRNLTDYRPRGSVPAANKFYADQFKAQLKTVQDEIRRIGDPPPEVRRDRFEFLKLQERDLLDKIEQYIPKPGVEDGWQNIEGFSGRVRIRK